MWRGKGGRNVMKTLSLWVWIDHWYVSDHHPNGTKQWICFGNFDLSTLGHHTTKLSSQSFLIMCWTWYLIKMSWKDFTCSCLSPVTWSIFLWVCDKGVCRLNFEPCIPVQIKKDLQLLKTMSQFIYLYVMVLSIMMGLSLAHDGVVVKFDVHTTVSIKSMWLFLCVWRCKVSVTPCSELLMPVVKDWPWRQVISPEPVTTGWYERLWKHCM